MSDCPPTPQGGTFLKPEHTRVPVLPPQPHLDSDCRGVASVLARVGDKWSVFVIMLLGEGPRRFNEIKRTVGGISQRMLTLTLRSLERDGLVTRTVTPTMPPRVDYELTPLGSTLWGAVEPVCSWARTNVTNILASREAFDERSKSEPHSEEQ